MFNFLRFFVLFFSFIYSFNLLSMMDNRFLPLYREMYSRTPCERSAGGAELLVMFGKRVFGDDQKNFNVQEINGRYDLIKVAKSLEEIGKPNPLSTQFRRLPELVLHRDGNIGAQGAWLGSEINFFNNFSFGFSLFLLHISSKQQFLIPPRLRRELNLRGGNAILFDKELRETNDLLGLHKFQYSHTSPSDIDVYLRYSTVREYVHKFRKVDAGISLGVLFPSGATIDINNPASIPFGGNGHYGIYGMVDITLELKEDLSVGLWFEVLKRLPKNQIRRMPINAVPIEFGAIIGQARIDPGITVGVSPFVFVEDIVDGFGFRVRYSMVWHGEDEWSDLRKNRDIGIDLFQITDFSQWAAEYFMFSLVYDFSKGATKSRKFAPIVYLEWYRPTGVFVAERAAKTNRISFGLEFSF